MKPDVKKMGGRYLAAADGLRFADDEDGSPLCTPIRVLGRSSNTDGTHPAYVVRVTVVTGKKRKIEIPMAWMSQPARIEEALSAAGVIIEPAARGHVIDYIRSGCPNMHYWRTNEEGWHDLGSGELVYVQGSKAISGNGSQENVLLPASVGSHFAERGSWQDWLTAAELCVDNPLVLASVCAAMSAAMLRLRRAHSWFFMLIGPSSTGKTSVMKLCASLLTDPGEDLLTWEGTENGLEAQIQRRKDIPTFLDEVGQGSADVLQRSAYRFVNGAGKLRANADGSAASVQRGRTVILSTGEDSPVGLMRGAGISIRPGQYARFIIIPVREAHGVFSDLHGTRNGAEFARRLTSIVQTTHGLVWPRYVKYLVAHQSAIPDMYRELEGRIQKYLTKDIEIPDGDGIVYRVLEQFVLIAFAGIMAVRAEVVPWKEKEIVSSVQHCFSLWFERYCEDTEDSGSAVVELVRYALQTNRAKILPFLEYGSTTKATSIGYVFQPRGSHELVFLILPGFLHKLIGARFSRREMEQALRESEYLVPGARGTPTKQVRIPGSDDKRASFYALRQSILQE